MNETQENPWKILIVDDEPEVHTVTKMVLAHYSYSGRPISFLHAYSAHEAKTILEANRDLAVILLDVIMEEEDSGLKLIGYIRETLANRFVRIILRTGQPGQIPEQKVIIEYDINDYKSKSDLTYQKLFTSITASLRAYDVILSLDRSTKELAREKELLSATIHSIDDAVIALDTEGKITLMNDAAARMTDSAFSEAVDHPFSEIAELKIHADDTKISLPPADGNYPGTGTPVILTPASGKNARIVSMTCAPIIAAGKERLGEIVVIHDITDQMKADEEKKKVQKLESIGILAGGIAHDFNNILTGIMGNVSLSKLDTPKEKKSYTYLGEAEKAVMRAQTLTRQLLSFSKGSAPVKAVVDGGSIAEEAVTTFLSSKFAHVTFTKEDNTPYISADKGQLLQVLINILTNAFEATEGKGTIRVEAGTLSLDASNRYGVREGTYLQIAVRDDGPGIREENMPKLFDPFFTTKPNGNGLGLTTSFTIVKRHGGVIVADSPAEGGAVFEIVIPSCEKPKQEDVPAESATSLLSVLLMDDDEFILKSVSGVLSYFGIDTDAAKDGAEAIEKYKKRLSEGRAYSIVVMDLIIPGGMGGKEAVLKLREVDPNAVVLVSSGYSDDPVMAEHVKYGFNGFIVKPYKPQDLITTIKKTVAAQPVRQL